MKNSIFLLFFLTALFIIPFISAADTTITIQTLPNHDVDISVLRPIEGYSLIESFHKTSNSNGTVSVTFSTEESEFYARVWIKKDNVIITYKKFEEGYPSGTPLTLEVYPEWYLKQKQIEASGNFADADSETETTVLIEDEEDTSAGEEANAKAETQNKSDLLSKITGFTLFKEGTSRKLIYYIVGGFALLIALGTTGFVIMKRRGIHFHFPKKQIRITKLSDKLKEGKQKKEQKDKDDDELAQAEAKLKELQEHIQELKSKPKMSDREKKIAAAKKRLMRDEKRLMKLREGKDDDSDSDENENDESEDDEEEKK
ncbi:hypothetical protein HYT25_03605 [Candidatus Pacearchaeota archaeon]|nr:hypothetical protein [Candidatus Pacearchaeota archaeon]